MLPDNIIEDLVREIAGEEAIPLVNLIKKKGNVSEFKLAEKLQISVNQVRNLLYKLGAHNLVSFTRKKDKKKGWYIYYWAFKMGLAGDLIITIKKRKLEELKEKLQYESSQSFFVCPDKHVRVKFENALETEFKCPECGQVLEEHDNKSYIENIKKQIAKLEEDLVKETELVRIRMEKIKAKQAKIEAKKKPKKIKKKIVKKKPKKKEKVTKRRLKKKPKKKKQKKGKKKFGKKKPKHKHKKVFKKKQIKKHKKRSLKAGLKKFKKILRKKSKKS